MLEPNHTPGSCLLARKLKRDGLEFFGGDKRARITIRDLNVRYSLLFVIRKVASFDDHIQRVKFNDITKTLNVQFLTEILGFRYAPSTCYNNVVRTVKWHQVYKIPGLSVPCRPSSTRSTAAGLPNLPNSVHLRCPALTGASSNHDSRQRFQCHVEHELTTRSGVNDLSTTHQVHI